MKKARCKVVVFLLIIWILCHAFARKHPDPYSRMTVVSCVSGLPMTKAAEMAKTIGMSEDTGLVVEDIRMQIVYQLARRSVVKIMVKDVVGSGIIWEIGDGIVITSNRHLLMKDVQAEVVFCNGETAQAQIMGYSQQYDIGFIKVPQQSVSNKILRDIYEAVPVLYETAQTADREAFTEAYVQKQILQVGAPIAKDVPHFSLGRINGLSFVPVFNAHVLETHCYARAGMSGGGVFDEGGRFLGMISGGEVPETAETKEAEVTYSIPPILIETEYKEVNK